MVRLTQPVLMYSPLASNVTGKSSFSDLWISFRDQTSFLTLKATPSLKTRNHSLPKPYYTRRDKRAIQRRHEAWTSWKNSSNTTSAAAYLHLQHEQRRSRLILRAERFSYEWKLANSAKLAACKQQQANGNQNPASTPSKWLPCNHRPRNDRPSQTDISRFQGSTPTFQPTHRDTHGKPPHQGIRNIKSPRSPQP